MDPNLWVFGLSRAENETQRRKQQFQQSFGGRRVAGRGCGLMRAARTASAAAAAAAVVVVVVVAATHARGCIVRLGALIDTWNCHYRVVEPALVEEELSQKLGTCGNVGWQSVLN